MKAAPSCPCGQTYDAYRSERIRSYADAYHEIAWTREHTSRAAVLRHWAASKAAEWARHLEVCAWEAEAAVESGPLPEDGDATFDVAALAFDPVCDEWGGEPIPAPQSPQDAPEAPPPALGRPRTQKTPQGRRRRSPARPSSAPQVALPHSPCDSPARDGKGTRLDTARCARGPPSEASPKARPRCARDLDNGPRSGVDCRVQW